MTEQTSPNTAKLVMIVILAGAAIIAIIGTILPSLIGLTGAPAVAMQLVFYAIAIVDVVVAFWLRARFKKTQGTRTVERR